MTRLIDADAYEHAVQGNPYVSDYVKTYVRCSIQSQPTIDAEPVRHGKWNMYYRMHSGDTFVCNICGSCFVVLRGADKMNVCPNCGADMRGE